jgi:TolB-like protein
VDSIYQDLQLLYWRPVKVRQVAEELGVRYVLEGGGDSGISE